MHNKNNNSDLEQIFEDMKLSLPSDKTSKKL